MSKSTLRIFHGTVNIVGMGRYLADWQRQQDAVADFIVYMDDTNRKNSHYNLHLERYSRWTKVVVQLCTFLLCLIKYDLFHFYFGRTLLPFNLDLPFLWLFRKKIIMTYCGTDIRLVGIEVQRNPYHHLLRHGHNHPRYDQLKKLMMRWQNLWIKQFFAPRGLYACALSVIPSYKINADIWLHNTMDIAAYVPDFCTNEIPVLVHAPSNPAIKGSQYVEDAIQALRAQGHQFKYIRLEKVPNDQAQRIYREQADIIIDQFLLGDFGTLALEGMYYGKPVCGFIFDEIVEQIPGLPIVNCTIETLSEKLVWLIEHPAERIAIGKAGREFVERYVDREKINQQVWQLYKDL